MHDLETIIRLNAEKQAKYDQRVEAESRFPPTVDPSDPRAPELQIYRPQEKAPEVFPFRGEYLFLADPQPSIEQQQAQALWNLWVSDVVPELGMWASDEAIEFENMLRAHVERAGAKTR